ncbi:polyprotein, partial [Tanacetum coccineum]
NDTTNQTYCVATDGVDGKTLQTALDWAWGPERANCLEIQLGENCYQPNNVKNYTSYAFDSYYKKQGRSTGSCDFKGVAMITATDLRVPQKQHRHFIFPQLYEVLHQEVNIRIGDRILQPKESFRYLGSVIHRSGRIDEDVAHRIGVGWMKWRAASGVMCDRRIPLKLKGKFYRVAIRPAMLYGSECWPITKAQANRVEVAELRMLRWTCGKTMVDMIPNGVFRAELDVDSIIDKMREGRLRWFGHVKRRPETAPVRRVEAMLVEGSRRRGRPKLRWEDRLKQDMKELLLSEDMTSDRNAWRDRIRISG